MGKVEGSGHQHVDELVLLRVSWRSGGQYRARVLHEQGEDDEQVGGDEGGDQRVLRSDDQPPVRHVGGGRHEPGKQPEREQAREAAVEQQETLKPLELLEAHGGGGVGGDREDPIGCGLGHHRPHPAHRLVEDGDRPQEGVLVLHAHERGAGQDREHHDRGHHVVGQRVERVRGDVEVHPVDGRLGLAERGAEEGTALAGGEAQRRQEHETEGHGPESEQQRAPRA